MSIFQTAKQLQHDLISNNIDFVAKQFQTIVDALYGTDNNNSREPISQPFYLDKTYIIQAGMQLSNSASSSEYNWSNYFLINMKIDSQGLTVRSLDYDPNAFQSPYQIGNTFSAEVFQNLNFNIPLIEGVDITHVRTNGSGVYYNDLAIIDDTVTLGNYSQRFTNIANIAPNGQTATISNYPPFLNHVTSQTWYPFIPTSNTYGINNFPYVNTNYSGIICFSPDMTNNDVNNIFNTYNIDSHDWTQITYNTQNGDTVYNYYNSNTGDIIINAGDFNVTGNGVVGVGGVGVALAYVDLEGIFDDIIGELNLSLGFDGSDGYEPLDFPSYEQIKYEDYSNFYIEPLHQYDNLPAPPSFDGTIDFGDIPKVVGHSATSYLDLLGTGLSALLCGCFITALIVRKMGR